ncbi:MAG TPA: polysaccharide biosynthesis tyrosine autokinase [Crocinitomix sp.]|nr:polysaccharide biosynthesis tyrosine autokinase [Crocinitomix sp.]
MDTKQPINKTNKLVETKDLVFIWKLILKNIGFLILIPLIAYFVGYIYTYRLTDVYGSKVQLLLKSNETYDYQDPIYKGLGAYGVYMDVQNQMRILQSKDLIEEIIEKINVNTSYYVVGKLKKKEVFQTLPFIVDVEIINNNLYEKPIGIKVLNDNEYKISYTLNNNDKTFNFFFDSTYVNEDIKLNLKKQYAFTTSNIDGITEPEYEIIQHSITYNVNKYRNSMKIENIEHTSILEITISDQLQARGKMFLDTLTSVYIDYSKRIQLEVNQNTLENIEKQIDTISVFIREKEIELLKYKDSHAILNLKKEDNEYFNKYVELTKTKRLLTEKQHSLKALESYILSISNDEHILPPSFTILKEDIYLSTAIKKIYELQLDLKSKSASFLPNNQNIIRLKNEIQTLKKDVIIYIGNLKEVLNEKLNEIDLYINENKINIKKIPISEQDISNIKRELDVNNKMYLFLLEKKTNTLIARAGIIPQVRVVESASPIGVIQPDKKKLIRLFVLAGFVLALFIAVIRKLFFERFENVTELAEATHLTVLGGLPNVKEIESKLIVTQKPKAQITESFRTLRTNLSYLGDNVDDKAKKILISSFFPGEGKTFVSSNTAALISMSDKKVLIIDFDLHKPKIHKTFNLENNKGISTFLIGKHKIDEIINKNVNSNIDVITAGPIPPNPSELILKKQMNDLFIELEQKYDFIIIDSPPFGLLNDAIELIKFINIFVVILNTKFIRRRGLSTIEDILSRYQNISTGVVLNDIKKTRFQYYYSKYTYKYNYNYGYNYGYGYGDSYSDYIDED